MDLKDIKEQLEALVDKYCKRRDNPPRTKGFWSKFEFNKQNKKYENQFDKVNPGTFRTPTSFSITQNEQHYLHKASEITGRKKSSIVEEAIIIWLALNMEEMEQIKTQGEK